ncbi:MAG TPA: hypothetical protein VGG34_11845 [Opitutaceae bacterium]|jgi:hypothetical protein
MKHPAKLLPIALLAICAAVPTIYLAGCAGGYVEGGGGVYYGGDPWIDDQVIVTGGGHPWYHGHAGAYVHPGSRSYHHR